MEPNRMGYVRPMRLLVLQDLPLRSSWFVDERGNVWRAGTRARTRPGRAKQRDRIRQRIAEQGHTGSPRR